MNGIINVYKEKGFTSFDVVAKLRGILKIKKIGHTGTLDPDATGVLPVCIGKATKLCEYLTEKEKTYQAIMRLGVVTDTLDLTGEVIKETPVCVSETKVKETIYGFIGKQMQMPPMYSALKVNGQKLCDLARKGIEVERQPREIEIFQIDITYISLPLITMNIHCSKGTYIRSLCDDIGKILGCGACMDSLIRVQSGQFQLKDALTLSQIEQLSKEIDPAAFRQTFTSIEEVLKDYPPVYGKENTDKLLVNGCAIEKEQLEETSFFSTDTSDVLLRMYTHQKVFIGLYRQVKQSTILKPEKMFL